MASPAWLPYRQLARQRQFPFGIAVARIIEVLRLFPSGKVLAECSATLKRFVYVLRNHERPPRYYTGVASDAPTRLAEHNRGSCTHTAKYGPWSIDVVIEFADERRAIAFERYLKSGSGVAFAQRHLR
jgi:predicted GIY-YIG superfamily endonuclease